MPMDSPSDQYQYLHMTDYVSRPLDRLLSRNMQPPGGQGRAVLVGAARRGWTCHAWLRATAGGADLHTHNCPSVTMHPWTACFPPTRHEARQEPPPRFSCHWLIDLRRRSGGVAGPHIYPCLPLASLQPRPLYRRSTSHLTWPLLVLPSSPPARFPDHLAQPNERCSLSAGPCGPALPSSPVHVQTYQPRGLAALATRPPVARRPSGELNRWRSDALDNVEPHLTLVLGIDVQS